MLHGRRNLKDLATDCNAISGNVLMLAASNRHYSFEIGTDEAPPGRKKSFKEAMLFMTSNVLLAWAFGRTKLPTWIEPKILKELRQTREELRTYFEEILEARDGPFIKSLLDANECEKLDRNNLEHEELVANMFIIQLAGYETTSSTILFALALLATHPEVQDWARQGISTYEESFGLAVRLRALMLETLRVYVAAPAMVRYSPETQTMFIDGRDRMIPRNTYVVSNIPAANNDPAVWGEDASEWRPQRWIEVVSNGSEKLKKDEIYTWNVGPRICAGKKFSQVEFVAVIGSLLRKYRLEDSPGLDVAIEDFYFNITPKFKNPESLLITFVLRQRA